MLALVHTACLIGVQSLCVEVEVHVGLGLPGFEIVGLPETCVRDSRVRVRAALDALGYKLPPRHVVLNFAPGDLRKTGTGFDVGVAIALLAASGFCNHTILPDTMLIGELSLGGELRRARGVLPHLQAAKKRGLRTAMIPAANAHEGALVEGMTVYAARSLSDVVAFLDQGVVPPCAQSLTAAEAHTLPNILDMRDVRGQNNAKRALEIAAAGRHHILFVGPPGAGKTMLARRLPGIMPRLGADEALEVASIQSAAGTATDDFGVRPFRAPHHTISEAALVGGGEPIRPGEVTLAHRGVLFLDELPEFRRSAIDCLRESMESGQVAIARARQRVTMPADALIVGAMNPCPCGFFGQTQRTCRCPIERAQQYQSRVSGPVLDRFDLQVQLSPLRPREIIRGADAPCSRDIAARVAQAHRFGAARVARRVWSEERRRLPESVVALLELAADRLQLTARGAEKTLRVARTIADLDARDAIVDADLAEAIQYRVLAAERFGHTAGASLNMPGLAKKSVPKMQSTSPERNTP